MQLQDILKKRVMIRIPPTYFSARQKFLKGLNLQQIWHFQNIGQAVYRIDHQSPMLIIKISHIPYLQSLSSRLPKMRIFAFFKKNEEMSAAFAPVKKMLSVFPDRIFPQKISTKI